MPHRQSGGELARLRSLSSDEGFRGLDGLASECFEVLDDRGEGWGHPASLRDVVESHNADVVGDPHAMSEECVTHANGDVIVASENRVGEMSATAAPASAPQELAGIHAGSMPTSLQTAM